MPLYLFYFKNVFFKKIHHMRICIPPPYTVWRNSPMRCCVSPFGAMTNAWSWVIYKERHFSWVWARESKAKVPGCGTWWWSFLCSCQKSEGAEGNCFYQALLQQLQPFARAEPWCPKHFPTCPTPDSVAVGIKLSTPELGTGHIQNTADINTG